MSDFTSALTIGETSVRQVGGLFSLNDLHKASGGELRHRPIEFIRLEQTQALIGELQKGGDPHLFLNTTKGRNGGTYACRELVIAYAAWISAAFHLKVIRVFLAVAAPQATPYTVQPGETLPDMHRTRAAFDAAAQAAASVQTAVFNAVLSGNDEWKSGRWMLAFIDDSAKAAPAYVQQMERGTFVTTWPRLVRDVASGECLRSSAELVAMANACTTRLQQSMSQEASQCRCIPENGTGTTKENTQCLTV